jgi:hypothetical protein
VAPSATTIPHRNPRANQPQRFHEYQTHQLRRARAERQPHAHLPDSLLDRMRDHRIESGKRQGQRQAGEERDQIHREPLSRDRVPNDRVHRSNPRDRLVAVDGRHRAADELRVANRVGRGLEHDGHLRIRVRAMVDVHLGPKRAIESGMPRVVSARNSFV